MEVNHTASRGTVTVLTNEGPSFELGAKVGMTAPAWYWVLKVVEIYQVRYCLMRRTLYSAVTLVRNQR